MDEAIAQFQKALEIKPNYPEAHYSLGQRLFGKGQMDEAIEQFQKALEINPNAVKPTTTWLRFAQNGQMTKR